MYFICRYNWSDPSLAILTSYGNESSDVLGHLAHSLQDTINNCSIGKIPVNCSTIMNTVYTDSGVLASTYF